VWVSRTEYSSSPLNGPYQAARARASASTLATDGIDQWNGCTRCARWLARYTYKAGKPMHQDMTVSQRSVSGVRRFQAAGRRGGSVGMLAGVLLLPLHVGAVAAMTWPQPMPWPFSPMARLWSLEIRLPVAPVLVAAVPLPWRAIYPNGTTGALIDGLTTGGPPIDSAFLDIAFGADGHLGARRAQQSKRLVGLTW
jgi:hypothetical protein